MTAREPPPDPAALARDWLTLVQTELAGLAEDRELRETWAGLLAMWGHLLPQPAHDPARPAAVAAAPGDGRDALLARIDELERRVAELERAKPAG